jgi:hypothetical protein
VSCTCPQSCAEGLSSGRKEGMRCVELRGRDAR